MHLEWTRLTAANPSYASYKRDHNDDRYDMRMDSYHIIALTAVPGAQRVVLRMTVHPKKVSLYSGPNAIDGGCFDHPLGVIAWLQRRNLPVPPPYLLEWASMGRPFPNHPELREDWVSAAWDEDIFTAMHGGHREVLTYRPPVDWLR